MKLSRWVLDHLLVGSLVFLLCSLICFAQHCLLRPRALRCAHCSLASLTSSLSSSRESGLCLWIGYDFYPGWAGTETPLLIHHYGICFFRLCFLFCFFFSPLVCARAGEVILFRCTLETNDQGAEKREQKAAISVLYAQMCRWNIYDKCEQLVCYVDDYLQTRTS